MPLKKHHILLLISILLTIGLRLPFTHITFYSVDEAVSAVAADVILEGGVPYRDAIDHRGPLTYYAYALIYSVFGKNNMAAVVWVYIGLLVGMAFLIFRIGEKVGQKMTGGWAALLFTVFTWTNSFHEMWAAHTEWLLVFFSLIGMNFYIDYFLKNDGKGIVKLILAGASFGMAALSKQVGLLDLATVLFFILLIHLKQKDFKKILSEGLILGIGWLIPIGFTIIYFQQTGALDDFIFYVWDYNTQYYLPETTWAMRLGNWAKLWGGFFIHKWLLVVLIFITVFSFRRIRRTILSEKPLYLLMIIWLMATALEAMAGGRIFFHYIIPALPAMALVAAIYIPAIREIKSIQPLQKWFIEGMLIIGMAFPILHNFINHIDLIGRDDSIHEFKDLANYVKENSDENDKIFVWGFAPEFYILSDRMPASRYTFTNVLSGHIPAANESKPSTDYAIVPGSWEILMNELNQYKPLFIIDTHPDGHRAYDRYPIEKFPQLDSLVDNYYQRDSVFQTQFPEVNYHLYRKILR